VGVELYEVQQRLAAAYMVAAAQQSVLAASAEGRAEAEQQLAARAAAQGKAAEMAQAGRDKVSVEGLRLCRMVPHPEPGFTSMLFCAFLDWDMSTIPTWCSH